MDLELVYKLIHLIVLPCWILLIIAPNKAITDKFVHAAFIPLTMVLVYVYFLVWAVFFGGGAEGSSFGSLKEVMIAFTSPVGMLLGWTHYLVFDLFVGMWIARDGKRRDIAHIWLVPCLLLSFIFGPVGLGLYLVLRKLFKKGGWSLNEV